MQRSEPKLEGPARTQADPRLVAQSDRGRATLTGRMFLSFRNPAFRLFFAAMMGQMGAMNMQMVARSWFMYELTGSAVLLGTVALANGLPIILFSLYGESSRTRFQRSTSWWLVRPPPPSWPWGWPS